MRMSVAASPFLAVVALVFTACGTMAPPPSPQHTAPRAGMWTLAYSGECAGRESEPLRVTRLDESAIVFDEFELLRNEAGEYAGSAIFSASMPVDGREIPYEIAYVLKLNDTGGFSGSETVVEDGGHAIACPIELRYGGAG